MSAGVVWTASNGAHRTGTSRSYTSNIVPEPFKVRVWWTNSLHYSWTFASVLVDSSPLSYLFTFAKVWIPGLHRTIVWHRSYSICRRSTFQMDRAQLRAEIPVGVCELKPYPVWFSYRRKRYPVLCEHSRQLLPTARTELGQWQGGKRGTGSRSVLLARFCAIVSFASVLSFPYQPINTNFSRRTRCGVGTGSCGQFRRRNSLLILISLFFYSKMATSLSGHLPNTPVCLLDVL